MSKSKRPQGLSSSRKKLKPESPEVPEADMSARSDDVPDELLELTHLHHSALSHIDSNPQQATLLIRACIHECDKMVRMRHEPSTTSEYNEEERRVVKMCVDKMPILPVEFHLIYANCLYYASLLLNVQVEDEDEMEVDENGDLVAQHVNELETNELNSVECDSKIAAKDTIVSNDTANENDQANNDVQNTIPESIAFLCAAIDRAQTALDSVDALTVPSLVADLHHSIARSLVQKFTLGDCSDDELEMFKIHVQWLSSHIAKKEYVSNREDEETESDISKKERDSIKSNLLEILHISTPLHDAPHALTPFVESLYAHLNVEPCAAAIIGLGNLHLSQADLLMEQLEDKEDESDPNDTPLPESKEKNTTDSEVELNSKINSRLHRSLECFKSARKMGQEVGVKMGEVYVHLGNMTQDEKESVGWYRKAVNEFRTVDGLPPQFAEFLEDWERDMDE